MPPNWEALTIPEIKRVRELMIGTGWSLVWTPPADVVREIIDAPDAETRRGVLLAAEARIVDDLAAVGLERLLCRFSQMGDLRALNGDLELLLRPLGDVVKDGSEPLAGSPEHLAGLAQRVGARRLSGLTQQVVPLGSEPATGLVGSTLERSDGLPSGSTGAGDLALTQPLDIHALRQPGHEPLEHLPEVERG